MKLEKKYSVRVQVYGTDEFHDFHFETKEESAAFQQGMSYAMSQINPGTVIEKIKTH